MRRNTSNESPTSSNNIVPPVRNGSKTYPKGFKLRFQQKNPKASKSKPQVSTRKKRPYFTAAVCSTDWPLSPWTTGDRIAAVDEFALRQNRIVTNRATLGPGSPGRVGGKLRHMLRSRCIPPRVARCSLAGNSGDRRKECPAGVPRDLGWDRRSEAHVSCVC